MKQRRRFLRRRQILKVEVCEAIVYYLEKKTINKEDILKILSKGEQRDVFIKEKAKISKTIDDFVKILHNKFEKRLSAAKKEK